jgi:hypothetical protein
VTSGTVGFCIVDDEAILCMFSSVFFFFPHFFCGAELLQPVIDAQDLTDFYANKHHIFHNF